ncbi:MAG TPA: PKD domain-containing protein, partial [Chitinophagaceae bacterium]|nr:PKD domain-containing protein [Chitinophagaceae bacterium]
QNPSHIFTSSGSYLVRLTVTSAGSCNRTASVQKNVVVGPKPLAAFTSTGACTNQPLIFTDNSSTATGTIGSWHWDFGDGSISLQQHPQKIYAAPGTYNVKLVVGTSSGCTSDTLEKSITIAGLPIAGITNSGACVREPISFQDASVAAGDAITRWYWSLGDGNVSVEQNPTNVYANPGAYTIKHVVESAGGCISDTATITVRVESIPLAGIAAINSCQGLNIQFRDSSSSDFGNITNWSWNFGDGNVATVQNPSHSYAVPGTYNVKLVVQSSNGCLSDTLSKTVTVGAIPEVLFTNTAVCIGQPIQFTNQTVLADGTITGYSWDFGDGSNAAVENPVHTYNREGDFTVTLTAITGNGCTATTTKIFHIAPVRAFAGNDTTVAIGQPLQLQASGGLDYQWTPADFLSADNIFNPIATLDKDQIYRVRVTTEEGCVGEDEIRIQVVKGPAIYVPGGFAPDGKNRIFRPILAGIEELYYFSVYNRWGQLVFTTREPGKGWDGRFNGVAQPSAVFVWMLKARDYLGQIITRNGTVVLIR